jgi:hypothetical protein
MLCQCYYQVIKVTVLYQVGRGIAPMAETRSWRYMAGYVKYPIQYGTKLSVLEGVCKQVKQINPPPHTLTLYVRLVSVLEG